MRSSHRSLSNHGSWRESTSSDEVMRVMWGALATIEVVGDWEGLWSRAASIVRCIREEL